MSLTSKSLKTPLRYPGGKSRATVKLAQFLPDLKEYTEFREPFLGGGSVAIYITKMYPDLNIWVNDLFEPLSTFWKCLQDHGDEITQRLEFAKQRHPNPMSAKDLFDEAKEYLELDVTERNAIQTAVNFYIVNKCSFSGLSANSSFSKQASDSNFSMRGIKRLPEFSELIQNWKITNGRYQELLTDDKSVFTYLDPPYDIGSNLYGRKGDMHKSFDHDGFATICDRFVGPQLISYNSSQLVQERFEGWTLAEFAHTYTMRSVGSYNTDQATRKELVILNYEV
jgi:site-specific DNA-adenine methylase